MNRRFQDTRRFAGAAYLVLAALLLMLAPYNGLCSNSNRTDQASDVFEQGNKLYAQRQYAEAAAMWEQLIKSGKTSAAVYFNLGNAWFKSGQLGKAIDAYRRARTLSPRDPDIIANLQFARNKVQGPTIAPSRSQQWLERFTLNEWTLALCVTAWLALLLLAAGQLRPQLMISLRTYIIAFAVLSGLLGILLTATVRQSRAATGIIAGADATVRQAPVAEAGSAFLAHDGAELRVMDTKGDWLQVTADGKRMGWVEKSHVLIVARPRF